MFGFRVRFLERGAGVSVLHPQPLTVGLRGVQRVADEDLAVDDGRPCRTIVVNMPFADCAQIRIRGRVERDPPVFADHRRRKMNVVVAPLAQAVMYRHPPHGCQSFLGETHLAHEVTCDVTPQFVGDRRLTVDKLRRASTGRRIGRVHRGFERQRTVPHVSVLPDLFPVVVPHDDPAPFTVDPFSGGPFKYRIEPDGSVRVWSVFNDRQDDDGKTGPATAVEYGRMGWTLDGGMVSDGTTTDGVVLLPPPARKSDQ